MSPKKAYIYVNICDSRVFVKLSLNKKVAPIKSHQKFKVLTPLGWLKPEPPDDQGN